MPSSLDTTWISPAVILITADAQGDGLDSNGNAEMTGGTVIVYGPTESMNGALDYDGSFAIAGGVLVAAGSAGMPQSPDQSSSQPSLLLVLDAVQQGGTPVQIQAPDGTEILSFTPVKSYQSIAFSSPELTAGETYNVSIGGSPYTSFTVSGVVTQIGNVMGRGRR